jgi:hypothetical protein
MDSLRRDKPGFFEHSAGVASAKTTERMGMRRRYCAGGSRRHQIFRAAQPRTVEI